jgi:4-hydroxy-3-methylbut-2-en-1-yl diphosphate reductase
MKVIKVTPRGFCFGVVSALNIAVDAAFDDTVPKPIFILGNIVHNHHISESLSEIGLHTIDAKGKTRLELLDQIKEGTVILTAHGVSDAVRIKARDKGLYVIDATCKYVTKTNDYIKDKLANGYEIVYIGKKNHPEPEGAVGIDPEHIHLVETEEDVKELKFTDELIAITNQTTMSYWDIEKLAQTIQSIYPHSEFENEICNATQVRQEGILKKAIDADLTLVVGDPFSNNTNKLADISENMANTKAKRIATVEEIDIEWLKGIETVAVTSGASTPTAITEEVIAFIEQFKYEDEATHHRQSRFTYLDILPRIKAKMKAKQ